MLKENKWDLIAFWHWIVRDLAFFLQFLDVLVNTQFGNGADRAGTYLERYPFIRFRNEKLFRLEVWIKATARLSVRVRHVVACNRLLTRQIANS